MMDISDPDYFVGANCASTDPELFFLDNTNWNLFPVVQNVCARCDIAERCLDYALKTQQEYGIWGGASTNLRNKMLKNNKLRVIHLEELSAKGAELVRKENKK